jgi:transcriptional regulator GlxA family with amidase domain
MAPHHLHRTFATVFDHTPHHTIAGLRLQEARRMLTSTDIPVSVICKLVGYSSAPSFTKLFRATFGAPPSAFRPSSMRE